MYGLLLLLLLLLLTFEFITASIVQDSAVCPTIGQSFRLA